MEIVGYISQSVIETLGLELKPNTPVFIGESNIEHIKSRHPYKYDVYYKDIGTIINSPDYVGLNPKRWLDSLCEAIQGKCGLCPCGRQDYIWRKMLCKDIAFLKHL